MSDHQTGESRQNSGEHTAKDEDRRQRPMAEIRFCGGCNPQIDRVAVAERVAGVRTAAQSTVYICGCQRACASGHRLRIPDAPAVVVAGCSVDAEPTAHEHLAEAAADALQRIAGTPLVDRPDGGVTDRQKRKE